MGINFVLVPIFWGNDIADGTKMNRERTSERSHYASLGFAAFVAKRRKSPGLDLRGRGIRYMPSSPKGTHSNGLPIRLLDDVRPLWGRVSAEMSPTAGQDLRLP